jgi:hypothetical protein
MAGEEVDVPGIGSMPKGAVTGGLALVAGIVVYAWWKNRSSSSSSSTTTPVLNPNDVVPATDYTSPGGDSSPTTVDSTGDTITTNSQWTQAATAYLAEYGWDPKLVSSALGKFLTRTGLSPDEITAVQTAIGAEGYPPEGGPWAIIPASTSTPASGGGGGSTAAPGAITSLASHVGPGTTNLTWNLGSGTTTYVLIVATPTSSKYGGAVSTTVPTDGMKAGQATGHLFTVDQYSRGATYKYTLTPYNGSAAGPSSSITVTNQ